MPKPLTIACVGLGGYAQSICEQLLRASRAQTPAVRLEAVCEPDRQLHAERLAQLADQGIRCYTAIDELLARDPVRSVWLPVPIHLHRPFTEKALAAGKAVMVEKPVAGAVQDVDAMIAARDRFQLPVAVGYQDMWDRTNLSIKRELLDGRIGDIQWASLVGCWPRDSQYFGRNQWAGALRRGETWVLDSPANNALAHYVNLSLYFLGHELRSCGVPQAVRAELYRTNDIENYDTCAMVARMPGNVPLTILLTHACERVVAPLLRIVGQRGWVTVEPGRAVTWHVADQTRIIETESIGRQQAPEGFAAFVRGVEDGRPTATLDNARAQTVLVCAASQAAAVHTIDAKHVKVITRADGSTLRALPGIENAFTQLAERNESLHASGLMPWSIAPQGFEIDRTYDHFAGPR